MRYPFLLFDADDTLFDFGRAQKYALEKSVRHFCGRFQESWHDEYDTINRQCWQAYERKEISQQLLKRKRFEDFGQQIGVEFKWQDINEKYLSGLSECTFLIDFAEELIEDLQRNAYTLAIVTNGLSQVQRPRFRSSNIVRHFHSVVISDEIGIAKPEPEIFQHALRELGNPDGHKTLMIGDNLSSDIGGGQNYGLDTCWLNPNGRPNETDIRPTYEIRHLLELRDIVGLMA